jgi:diguanylate cyclase (GGDEF)-like protein
MAAQPDGFERALLHEGRAALLCCRADGVVTYVSPHAARLLGCEPLAQPFASVVAPSSAAEATAYLSRLATADAADATYAEVVVGDGSARRVLEVMGVNRLRHPELRSLVLVLADVTSHRRREAELERRATTDELTGLPNRLLLLDRLRELVRAGRTGAVAVVDVDRFKRVNDGFGHHAGDELLRELGRRLACGVPALLGATVCRLGGDEFAVLLPGLFPDQGAQLLEDVLARVAAPLVLDGQDLVVTATAGVAVIAGSAELALREADAALYAAKRRRARVLVYDPKVVRAERDASREFEALRQRAATFAVEARTDELTGLANRRKFNEDLGVFDGSAAGRDYAVVFLDLDEFGQLNKRYGQEAGDEELRRAAAAFAAAVRAGDVVYRHGGEEMVALLHGATLEEAARVAERMRDALDSSADDGRPCCTVSVGVAAYDPARDRGCHDVVRAADRAMRHAKEAGRNRVAVAEGSASRVVTAR